MDVIAIIGFADQVFNISLKMYAIISGASQFGEEQDMLFWKLQLQCIKFKLWHDNLTPNNDDPKALDKALLEQGEQVRQVVVGALLRIYRILNDAMNLYDKYGLGFIEKPSYGMTFTEVKVLSSNIFVKDPEVSARNAQKAVGFWKRCKWQIKDKEKFGALLNDLSDLNDDLNDIFPSRMRNLLSDVVASALISSAKVPALSSVVKALTQGDDVKNLNSLGPYSLTTKPTDHAEESVEQLAAIKCLAEALSINDTSPSSNVRQFSVLIDDPNMLKTAFLASRANQGGTDFPQLENGFYHEQPVLVEWKKYDRTMPYRERQIINNRVDKLAIFLNKTKPHDFCIPECTAYLHVDDESKFAFLYRLPTLAADETKWTTLRDVFDRPNPTLNDRCSLEGRYLIAQTLARSFLQLHVCGWVHKGIRSSNILLFPKPSASIKNPDESLLDERYDFSAPLVVGFGYSRPDKPDEETIERSSNPRRADDHDLYRHPKLIPTSASYRNGPRFEKQFDIYALGLVLLELAFQSPLINFHHAKDTPESFLARLRSWYVPQLASNMGTRYRDCVQYCLGVVDNERTALGVQSGTDSLSNQSRDNIQLDQVTEFSRKVVLPLGRYT